MTSRNIGMHSIQRQRLPLRRPVGTQIRENRLIWRRSRGDRMRAWQGLALAVAVLAPAKADVILKLPTKERVVALTLRAAATDEARYDHYRLPDRTQSPVHGFPLGYVRARQCRSGEKKLSTLPFVELENHSWDHPLCMQGLSDDDFRAQLLRTDSEVRRVTGTGTAFFRFPAISYNARTLNLTEDLGFTVVHYRWETGDPDKSETADKIIAETLERTRPGDILIHHVNGRGWQSGEAMPGVVEGLLRRGFRFVLLRDYLPARRAR